MRNKLGLLLVLTFLLAACVPSEAFQPSPTIPASTLIKTNMPPTASAQPPTPTVKALTPTPYPPTETPLPTITVSAVKTTPYAVILLSEEQVLPAYSSPDTGSAVVTQLAFDRTALASSGEVKTFGDTTYRELILENGNQAWVDDHFLIEYRTVEQFCADPTPKELINQLAEAILTLNAELLPGLPSPKHGFSVQNWWGRPIANYSPEEFRWVLESTYEMNWGDAPGSGYTTIGPFHEVVLPELQTTFENDYELFCEDSSFLEGFLLQPWPFEYTNINFYRIHYPGTEEYGGLDYIDWLIGFETIADDTYLISLIHFEWEP